jgi:hypothetical protein
MPAELRNRKQAEAEALFRRIGITVAVRGEGGDPDAPDAGLGRAALVRPRARSRDPDAGAFQVGL